jgi:nicotinamidase-related amidase
MSARPISEKLESRGFAGRSGFGQRPALVVVDFTNAFTDPEHRLGSFVGSEIAQTNKAIALFRARDLPIVFTAIEYDTPEAAAASNWSSKIEGVADLYRGSHATQQDQRLNRHAGEPVVNKLYASAFFGTELDALLRDSGTDTVVIAGCSTSGCVRATAVDACQLGFRVVVCREAVADRSRPAHDQALMDIDMKYGDVLALDEIEDRLEAL